MKNVALYVMERRSVLLIQEKTQVFRKMAAHQDWLNSVIDHLNPWLLCDKVLRTLIVVNIYAIHCHCQSMLLPVGNKADLPNILYIHQPSVRCPPWTKALLSHLSDEITAAPAAWGGDGGGPGPSRHRGPACVGGIFVENMGEWRGESERKDTRCYVQQSRLYRSTLTSLPWP